MCVWKGSTCCGSVEKGLTLEGGKGNPGGESGERRHGGEIVCMLGSRCGLQSRSLLLEKKM